MSKVHAPSRELVLDLSSSCDVGSLPVKAQLLSFPINAQQKYLTFQPQKWHKTQH